MGSGASVYHPKAGGGLRESYYTVGPLFDLSDKLMTLALLLNRQIVTNEVRVGCFCAPFGEPCQVALAFGWGPQEDPSQLKVSGPLP